MASSETWPGTSPSLTYTWERVRDSSGCCKGLQSQFPTLTRCHDVFQRSIFNVLCDENLYPHHYQCLLCLTIVDYANCMQFCQWIQQHQHLNHIASLNLFPDEASFGRDDMTNFHNTHIWVHNNPHGIHPNTNSWLMYELV